MRHFAWIRVIRMNYSPDNWNCEILVRAPASYCVRLMCSFCISVGTFERLSLFLFLLLSVSKRKQKIYSPLLLHSWPEYEYVKRIQPKILQAAQPFSRSHERGHLLRKPRDSQGGDLIIHDASGQIDDSSPGRPPPFRPWINLGPKVHPWRI